MLNDSQLPASAPESPPETALSAAGLSKRFPRAGWVVQDFTLSVRRGEILALVGPSGCGKTTLLRLIAGFESPERGEIYEGGRIISRPGWQVPPERRDIGMVFQENTLFPHLSVRQNVQFGLSASLYERVAGWLRKPSPPDETEQAREERYAQKRGLVHLMELCRLTELAERYPDELSGGQQQRVALARALATRPRLLLLDEPFSNLDSSLLRSLREDVRAILRQSGTTAILVSHDQEEAINMGDRLAVMNRGRLEQLDIPEEILQRPVNRFVAGFIGYNRFIPGRVEGDRVHTELGDFPLPPNAPPTRAVDVLLRPNELHLSENGAVTHGQVHAVQYLGGQPLCTLTLPSGVQVQALLRDSVPLKRGDRAGIRFEPSPLVLFPAE